MPMADVTLFEVGPRDGLQNEAQFVNTDIKVDLINRLSMTGLKKIEATSFVSPKWVPQMADNAKVMATINRKSGVTYSALTPNLKGMEAAIDAGVDEVAIFAAASESFSQKNINCSISESLVRFKPVMELAKSKGLTVRGYVSCVTHCPYDGRIDPASATKVTEELIKMGCYQVSLGDTIGRAEPEDIKMLLAAHAVSLPTDILALHCHDTYGHALENIQIGLDYNVDTFDCSVAGLGGCPYAEGASGNVATEAVLKMLNNLGVSTGIDIAKINDVACFINNKLGK